MLRVIKLSVITLSVIILCHYTVSLYCVIILCHYTVSLYCVIILSIVMLSVIVQRVIMLMNDKC